MKICFSKAHQRLKNKIHWIQGTELIRAQKLFCKQTIPKTTAIADYRVRLAMADASSQRRILTSILVGNSWKHLSIVCHGILCHWQKDSLLGLGGRSIRLRHESQRMMTKPQLIPQLHLNVHCTILWVVSDVEWNCVLLSTSEITRQLNIGEVGKWV